MEGAKSVLNAMRLGGREWGEKKNLILTLIKSEEEKEYI